jgi:hypothetical protein
MPKTVTVPTWYVAANLVAWLIVIVCFGIVLLST